LLLLANEFLIQQIVIVQCLYSCRVCLFTYTLTTLNCDFVQALICSWFNT
jgi:hypothetical protein